MQLINKYKRTFIILASMVSVLYSYSQTWSDVGGGTNNNVYAFGKYNNKLIVTGGDTFGNKPIYAIASWDGIEWDSLGNANPVNGVPYCYFVFNNELFAGGGFQMMGGVANTYQIARWNGSSWLSAGSTNNDVGQIKAMAAYNNNLYVAGNITKIGGVNVNRIAKWNGSSWSGVGGGVTGGFGLIYCMAVYNGQLYVGGDFSGAGGKTTYSIARWNGAAWDSVGCTGFNDVVVSMVVDTIKNVLYVGGSFTLVGNASVYQPMKYVASWNDTIWSQVGNPITDGAIAMEMYHNELYVSCQSAHGLITDTIIARWDGFQWHKVTGPNSTVFAMEVYKDTLYVGGAFTMPYNNIARWHSPLTNVSEEKKSEIEYLGNNIPNPFNNITSIPYFVPLGSSGTMTITDIHGKTVETYALTEGSNKLEVSLLGYGEGMYFYTLTIDNSRIIRHKKMIFNK